ncbi:DUF6691 family protein [Microvirga yunnanensis]|uniref:DUF6691 family protein n=1 Tax=Microvirga yunnanensis TaxID=2953740 RepID=UPI002905749C|nr:DUF6691 family protein [Microvirga sp. HBU65207]
MRRSGRIDVGLCPGPALTVIAFGPWQVVVFAGAMVAGMIQLAPAERLLPRAARLRARPSSCPAPGSGCRRLLPAG